MDNRIWRDHRIRYRLPGLLCLTILGTSGALGNCLSAESTLWNQCIRVLQAELPEQQFNTWIRPLQAVEDGAVLRCSRRIASSSTGCSSTTSSEFSSSSTTGRQTEVVVEVGSRRPRAGAGKRRPQAAPITAGAIARRVAAESRFHVRQLRRGQEQPAGQGGGDPGRREPGQVLQPAVYLRRCWPRQDAPYARDRQRDARAQSGGPRQLCALGALRRRHGPGPAAQHDFRVQARLSVAGCAAY